MDYEELIRNVLLRARALKLVDPETNQVDTADCERATLKVVRDLVSHWDFDQYTVVNEQMFETEPGRRLYAWPADFGRRLYPKTGREAWGVALNDGTSEHELMYRPPDEFRRRRQLTGTGRPGYFTELTARQLQLDPPPDSNGGDNYTGVGTYVAQVTVEELDGPVKFGQPSALEDMVIGQLAMDWTHPNVAGLAALWARGTTQIVNDSRRARYTGRSRYATSS